MYYIGLKKYEINTMISLRTSYSLSLIKKMLILNLIINGFLLKLFLVTFLIMR
jgi:hypothetical protein